MVSVAGERHSWKHPDPETSAGTAQNQICGADVKGNLQVSNKGTGIEIGGTSCAGHMIGGNL